MSHLHRVRQQRRILRLIICLILHVVFGVVELVVLSGEGRVQACTDHVPNLMVVLSELAHHRIVPQEVLPVAHTAHLELVESLHGLVQLVPPLQGAVLAGTHELPPLPLVPRKGYDQLFLLISEVLYVREGKGGLGLWHFGCMLEGQLFGGGEFSRIGEGFDAFEEEEPVVAEEEGLALLAEDGVGVLDPVDVLREGLLLYELVDLLAAHRVAQAGLAQP